MLLTDFESTFGHHILKTHNLDKNSVEGWGSFVEKISADLFLLSHSKSKIISNRFGK